MCAQTAGSPFSADPLLLPWVLESVEAEQTILAENAGHQGMENGIFQKPYERRNVRYLHNVPLFDTPGRKLGLGWCVSLTPSRKLWRTSLLNANETR